LQPIGEKWDYSSQSKEQIQAKIVEQTDCCYEKRKGFGLCINTSGTNIPLFIIF